MASVLDGFPGITEPHRNADPVYPQVVSAEVGPVEVVIAIDTFCGYLCFVQQAMCGDAILRAGCQDGGAKQKCSEYGQRRSG
jgi:hypothetical protein